MGNCIRHESSMDWAGEDWGFSTDSSSSSSKKKMTNIEGDTLLRYKTVSARTTTDQVKVRITKKELLELLHKIEVQGLPLDQVLAQLINGGDRLQTNHHHGSWRPNLQSIPELN
ncbi:hypothetical protein RJ641_034613 [Dillenia turbinata]|uniref:Uncharacterized protein n=1 Tax=Dillenia turbinata TaxID=194707 RepID=A0AAN8ZHR7_9MAGN